MITSAQANVVLDLYEQCQVVARAWEQIQTHQVFKEAWEAAKPKDRLERFGSKASKASYVETMAKKTQENFDEAVDELRCLELQAGEFEVAKELIDNLIALTLPDCDFTKKLAA